MSFRLCTHLLLAPLLFAPLAQAAGPPPRPATPAEVARWVKDLGDDEFAIREAASRQLRSAGQVAEEALEKAVESKDREVVRRAQAILADFRWGIYPDTPEVVAAAVRDYRSGEAAEKALALRKLFDLGSPGWRATLRVLRREEDPGNRQASLRSLDSQIHRAGPLLVQGADAAPLEAILEQIATADPRAGLGNYTAYWLLKGEIPARIARHQELARKDPKDEAQQIILARLYRAAGDLKAAQKAAEAVGRNPLVRGLLHEAGNWKELAARPDLLGPVGDIEKAAFRTAYHRLAGNSREFADGIAELGRLADVREKPEKSDPDAIKQIAHSLFLNDHPKEALELMARFPTLHRGRLEVLLARGDFRAARALVEEARKAGDSDLPHLEIAWAFAQHGLGEKDEAIKTFKAYGDRIKPGGEAAWLATLVRSEARCGLSDLADEHAVRILGAGLSGGGGWKFLTLDALYPDYPLEASALWPFLRISAGPADSLKHLRLLLTGKAKGKELTALVDQLTFKIKAKEIPPEQADLWLALGKAADLCKQPALARRCWLEAGTPRAVLNLADQEADKKEWREAARLYDRAYREALKKIREAQAVSTEEEALLPLALYLAGWARESSGDAEAGRRMQEQAQWLPLGNIRVRLAFGNALAKRDLKEGARRALEIVRKTTEPGVGETEALLANQAAWAVANNLGGDRDHAATALVYEQGALHCLRAGIHFPNAGSYAVVPRLIHRHRGLALFRAGKVDEALAEAELSRSCQPGRLSLAVDLVAGLEKAGRKKDADRLYREARAGQERILADFPRCGSAHNNIAWLAACCKRDLEEGLKEARKALELSPERAGDYDTLAEVLFQLGKKAEAVEALKKAIALDLKRAYFRKQLKRMEAGDPKAERPDESE